MIPPEVTNFIAAGVDLAALIVAVWAALPSFAAGVALGRKIKEKPATWPIAVLWAVGVGVAAWLVTLGVNVWMQGGA